MAFDGYAEQNPSIAFRSTPHMKDTSHSESTIKLPALQEVRRVLDYRRKLLKTIEVNTASVSTLKLLQLRIEEETGNNVGLNTLRRFFGLLTPVEPSFSTWSTLDDYLAKQRLQLRGQRDRFSITWEPLHEMNAVLTRGKTRDLIAFLLSHHGSDIYPLLFASVVNHLVTTQQDDALRELFQTDELFDDHVVFADYAAEIVGTLLRTLPNQRHAALQPIYNLPHFREAILYFFIDYRHFSGYYWHTLKSLTHRNLQESIFITCIDQLRTYLFGQEIKDIQVHPPTDLAAMFPILIGRYIGILILSSVLPIALIWDRYITPNCKRTPPQWLFFEIFPALLIRRDFHSISRAFQQYYEDLYDFDHWFAHSTHNLVLISEAMLYLHERSYRRAQIVATSIQLDRTSISYYEYVKLFHNTLLYHLGKVTGASKSHLDQIAQNQSQLVELTKFTRLGGRNFTHYFG